MEFVIHEFTSSTKQVKILFNNNEKKKWYAIVRIHVA